MAIMADAKNTSYKGEALVWDCLEKNLDKDAVVYFNREIKGRTYDFCVLLKNKGVLIIEVKGWSSDGITVNSPDEIIVDGYDKPQRSPRKQAYGYQYALRTLLKEKCNVTPLYFNMVCYPFISSADCERLHLDLISPESFTLFADDIVDPEKFKRKIDLAYDNEKGDAFEPMTEETMDRIRSYYEPNYTKEGKQKERLRRYYSVLRAIPGKVQEDQLSSICEEYFQGTKEFVFLENQNAYNCLLELLEGGYKERNISPVKGNISLGYKEFEGLSKSAVFRAFNIEVYCVNDLSNKVSNSIEIIEGNTNDFEREVLEILQKITTFNYAQFQIEHGTEEKNILVQAGAGTGKTYSMVSRIAYLCNKSKDPVNNLIDDIALVTFTNDAADNMKVRIRQMFMNYYLLTADETYIHYIEDVNFAQISTIHKFALSILQKVPVETGLSTNFDISKNTYYRRQLYERKLDTYIEEKSVKSPRFINEFKIPFYDFVDILIDFADRLSTKSIDINTVRPDQMGKPVNGVVPFFTDIITNVIQPAEKEYDEYLRSYDSISLNQCLILLHNIVRKTGELPFLSYKYIFIDEFQDTDNVQIEIFKDVQKALPGDCKLFVVGDLKQSIYRFRGATISAFDQLVGKREDLWERFTLNRNYRTDHHLLDQYDERFKKWGEEKYLIYRPEYDRLASSIDFHINPDKQFECVEYHNKDKDQFYANLFDILQDKKSELEKIAETKNLNANERTIAILVRSNYQIQQIVDESKKHQLLIETKSSGDLYNLPSTVDFYRLILALCNPDNAVYLTNLIHSNYVKLNLEYNRLHGLDLDQKKAELIQILNQYFKLEMGKSFERVVKDAYEKPVLSVIRDIYEKLMPWKHYSYDANEQRYYMANYEYLIEKILQSRRLEELTLNQIRFFLDIYVKTKQKEKPREPEKDTSGVHIICSTVHRSKGLEYGTVILPFTNATLDNTRQTKMEADWRNGQLSYYIRFKDAGAEYNSNYDAENEKSEQVKEETRILYVALTRAIKDCIWFKDLDCQQGICWSTLLEKY